MRKAAKSHMEPWLMVTALMHLCLFHSGWSAWLSQEIALAVKHANMPTQITKQGLADLDTQAMRSAAQELVWIGLRYLIYIYIYKYIDRAVGPNLSSSAAESAELRETVFLRYGRPLMMVYSLVPHFDLESVFSPFEFFDGPHGRLLQFGEDNYMVGLS